MKLQNYCIMLALTLSITACSSDDNQDLEKTDLVSEDTNPQNTDNNNERKFVVLSIKDKQMVSNNNDFAFQLFCQVNKSEGLTDQSMMVSPLSITCALGMLNNGAAGETQKEINKMLGFNESQENVNEFARKMIYELPALDKETRVVLANTIFLNKNYQLKTTFAEKAKQYYNAEPESRDFTDGKTLDAINQWASDKTQKMIERILSPDEFNPSAVSYLLNATYFRGVWTEKFDKADTREEYFNGNEKKVQMMHQNHQFRYVEDEMCQALRLPFGNTAYAMTILLPREGKTIGQVAASLNAQNWNKYQYEGTPGEAIVDVKLPRFETQTEIYLNKVMATLGMPNAFDMKLADFSEFCNINTYIEKMKQVSKIKLDEEGAVAAAVTINQNVGISGEPGEVKIPNVNFHATRPFLYIISEQSSGAILFIGQYYG